MVCPIWLTIFFSFQSLNEPRLGARSDPGMELKPFPSSIGWDSNPQPSNLEQLVFANHQIGLLPYSPSYTWCTFRVLVSVALEPRISPWPSPMKFARLLLSIEPSWPLTSGRFCQPPPSLPKPYEANFTEQVSGFQKSCSVLKLKRNKVNSQLKSTSE